MGTFVDDAGGTVVSDSEEDDILLAAISKCIEGMVTSFIVMAAYVDSDGDRNIYSNTMRDQRCHESMGLLGFGLAVENRKAGNAYDE